MFAMVLQRRNNNQQSQHNNNINKSTLTPGYVNNNHYNNINSLKHHLFGPKVAFYFPSVAEERMSYGFVCKLLRGDTDKVILRTNRLQIYSIFYSASYKFRLSHRSLISFSEFIFYILV
uniref:Uncharacterized protein n=1 Tax=Trichogramma kaykai TaxID=54128 RepID=A0ABD2VSJ4_9HYME